MCFLVLHSINTKSLEENKHNYEKINFSSHHQEASEIFPVCPEYSAVCVKKCNLSPQKYPSLNYLAVITSINPCWESQSVDES